jgi:hypothetical protein
MPNASLEAVGALVGEWRMEAPQFPGAPGQAVFEWVEGGAYLLERSTAPDPAPDSTWLIGGDDAADSCFALYHDSRDVRRVYRMGLGDGVWRIWREAPSFWQRFIGTLSDDGSTIRGAWEMSDDGSVWEHDFDLIYTRVR